MKKISYYLILIVAAGVVVVSFWVYQKYIQVEEPNLLLFDVRKGSIQEVVKVRGEVASQKDFDMEFPFPGIVEEIYVKEGDEVEKDSPLMKLETINFELELTRLNAVLLQNQANLTKLRTGATAEELAVARTKVSNAQATLSDAQKKLESVKNKSKADLQAKEAALENANKNLSNVQAKADVDLKTAYISADSILGDAFIKAEHAVYGPVDELFYSSGINRGNLIFISSDSSAEQEAESLQSLAQTAVDQFKDELNSLAFDYAALDVELIKARDHLLAVKKFLQRLHDAVNAQVNLSDSATHSININTVLTNVEVALSGLNSREQAISTQKVVNQSVITTAEIEVSNAVSTVNVQKAANQNTIILAEAEVNNASSNLNLAQNELSFLQAGTRSENIRIAQGQIQEIQGQIASINEKIKKSVLTAPLAAKVDKIWLEEGEVFKLSQLSGPAAISLSVSGHKIHADVSELEIGKIRELNGNDVLIELDAFPGKKLIGKVVSIDPLEIIKEGDKYYRVNVYIEEHGLEVRSGMNADLIITISFKDNVVKILEFIISYEEEIPFVMVLDEGERKRIEIQTGISDGELIEVVSGLSEGQVIVIVAD